MKNLNALLFVMFLAMAGAVNAQTVPSTTSPAQQPVPTTPTEERKPDLTSPQTPARPANIPSEDTLIKGQRSSGAVIKDTLTPSNSRKAERMNRRNSRKGTAERGDTTNSNQPADTTRKP